MTPMQTTSATGAGHPQASANCQKVKAPTMAIAPCAKLKMPVVV